VNSPALGRVIAVRASVVAVRRAAAALSAVDEAIAIAAGTSIALSLRRCRSTSIHDRARHGARKCGWPEARRFGGPLGAKIRVLV